jgi:hypothetical protein
MKKKEIQNHGEKSATNPEIRFQGYLDISISLE